MSLLGLLNSLSQPLGDGLFCVSSGKSDLSPIVPTDNFLITQNDMPLITESGNNYIIE